MFARANVSPEFIKLLGRWDSEVYQEYIDPTWNMFVGSLT
jgi:hypothetical protein